MLLSGCGRLFFLPESGHRWDPAEAGIEYSDIRFEASDGVRLHGWYLPSENPRGTVLFLHGNAENISTHIAAVHWLPGAGYNVFMPDYRGFGRSEGQPGIDSVHRDAHAALETVFTREAIRSDRTFVLGQSLGGSIAITAVARYGKTHDIHGLIADSAFSSYRSIAREKLAESWLGWPLQWLPLVTVSDTHAPIDHVSDISPVPLVLITGTADRVVPSRHSQALYDAASPPAEIWRIDGTGHTRAFARDDVRRRVVEWMDEK